MGAITSNVGRGENVIRIGCLKKPNQITTWRIRPKNSMDSAVRRDHWLQAWPELGYNPARVGEDRCTIERYGAKMVVRIEVELLVIAIWSENNLTIVDNRPAVMLWNCPP